jgi:hypothetical protein
MKRFSIVLTLLFLTLTITTVASAQNTHAGGQSGSVTNNALIKSVGDNKISSSIVADDGATATVTGALAVTGVETVTGALTASGGASVTGRFVGYSTKTALTPAATVTLASTGGNFFTLTPGEDETINATTVGVQGQLLFLEVVTSGTTSRTLTFGTNFKSTGTLATGTTSAKTFMLQFLSDGTNYVEVTRTTAQ